ncbi:Trihelix transcription factor GTL1 [Sesamum alatum]|uniref:Trihelix transcription factor GTL1 n=1 Tax=Sesamum alatum TaxID=300844 RepID=A0AAE1XJQ0_9LAMI|nr:Trihelix transcription factor GTL1 [Sesamum alatum]
MHSGLGIPGIQHQHQQAAAETSCAPVHLLSMNQTHLLEQIHTLPTTQQLFLNQHQHQHFLPPHHHHHHYGGTAYFPAVNFKLGLSDNNICPRNHDGSVSSDINNEGGGGGGDAFLRGSEEQYQVPEARQPSLGMLHCWQNQQDSSAIKQPPFWEPLAAEVSNENSEIVDRQEHLEMNQKEALLNCLEMSRSRVHFGELEAIYKRLATAESNNNSQTAPTHETLPVNPSHLPVALIDHGSEASASLQLDARKKRKKKKKKNHHLLLVEFFGNLVKQVMDHQDNLHNKFTEVIERLEEERRAREEAWRNQELAHFQQESAARARDKASAQSREAMIVSYLEKLTGQKINLPTGDDDHVGVHDMED